MTIAMLSLAGIPGTVGFIGKFQLIHALVDGDYTWLAIVLVIGSMISLGYYLRVVAAIWMTPPAVPRARDPARHWPPIAGALGPEAGGARAARPARRRARAAGRPSPRSCSWRSVRRRQHLLRDLPLAAVQPRRPRGPRAQRDLF